jgi:hypothetical protein
VPHRGQRNEPAFVHRTLHRLAAARGTDASRLARLTLANTRALFSLPVGDAVDHTAATRIANGSDLSS